MFYKLFITTLTAFTFLALAVSESENNSSGEVKILACREVGPEAKRDLIYNERLLGQDVYVEIRGLKETLDQVQRLESLMERFYESLGTFLNQTGFDISGFEAHSDAFEAELRRIERSVEQSFFSKRLTTQLLFCKTLMVEIKAAVGVLKQYKRSNVFGEKTTPGHRSIYEITELGIRALFLKDSEGVPDILRPGFTSEVSSLRRRLRFWKEEFKELSQVDDKLRLVYTIKTSQARDALEELELAISEGTQ